MRPAAADSPICRSISSADRSSAVGLAMFLPAMSGALPCTASKTAASSPRFAAPTVPSPPTRPAHKSDTISPYRFGSSSTSNFSGFITRFMHAASTICSSYAMPGYSAATVRAQRMKRPSLIFMMFALWIAVMRVRPIRVAYANAKRAMRVEARSVMIFRLSTTPGTTSCSRPEYKSSVFSRTMTRSTCSKRDRTCGRLETGRRFAYRSSAFRSPTFTLVKPSPTGVVTGPFRATRLRRIDSSSVVGQRRAVLLDCDEARVMALPVHIDTGRFDDADNGVGDFGPDAVTGDESDDVGLMRRECRRELPRRGAQDRRRP